MLVESVFEGVLCLTYVLCVVAFVTEEHVDDVFGCTCEVVSNGESFSCGV